MNQYIRLLSFSFLLLAFTALACAASAANVALQPLPGAKTCLDCHKTETPAIYNEWTKSRHFNAKIGCRDCHGAKGIPAEQGSFLHHGRRISIIVSPKVCGKCHEKQAKEFGESRHANAYDAVNPAPCKMKPPLAPVLSLAKLFIDYYAGNVDYRPGPNFNPNPKPYGPLAAGTNGCWQCHGSKVKIKDGKLDPVTWPNTGIGRINPDGSKGNCSACHERHIFSAARARRPQLCGLCHNEGGGEPQLEVYNSSRHGITYHLNMDKMNLDSPKWVAGEDYTVAPTCATCHLSAAPRMPVTHNVDARILNFTEEPDENRFIYMEKARDLTCRCGPKFCQRTRVKPPGQWVSDYCWINRFPDQKSEQYMTGVCKSCHANTIINNYIVQYLDEIDLIMTQWVEPGRELYFLATEILEELKGNQYVQNTNALDDIWGTICNHDAKYPMYGAAMMSAAYAQANNGAIASHWYNSYLPALAQIINQNICSDNKKVRDLTQKLKQKFCEILSNPTYGGAWMGPEGKPDRLCYNYIDIKPCTKKKPGSN